MPTKLKDETGKIYGDLIVTGFSHVAGRVYYWSCKCKCGGTTIVRGGSLRQGVTKSCGCKKGYWKHGHNRRNKKSLEYQSWVSMLQRCRNSNDSAYSRYGGRGIAVCPEWRKSFKQFFADMGPRPSSDYSIDRIDNNGDYTPSNCRWATRLEQMANMRTNTMLTFSGRTQHMAGWCRELGITPSMYCERRKLGWTPGQAMGLVSR